MLKVTIIDLEETDGGNYTCSLKPDLKAPIKTSVTVVILPRESISWLFSLYLSCYLSSYLFLSLYIYLNIENYIIKHLQVVRCHTVHRINSAVEVVLALLSAMNVMVFLTAWMAQMKAPVTVVCKFGY